jgi:protocatechuate 3,4-dioxygenase alpha subunit
VGPFFKIGLEYLIDRMTEPGIDEGKIEIRGRVLDRDGAPVPDAMLEFWNSGFDGSSSNSAKRTGIPEGFKRVASDLEGCFATKMNRPLADSVDAAGMQAPHALVLVFARGLQRNLVTRVYFENESANVSDVVLRVVPEARRHTLIAKQASPGVYRWDVILQGPDETVFFAW